MIIRMAQVDEEVNERVDELVLMVINEFINQLIIESPVNTGQLRQSFQILGKNDDGDYVVGSPLKTALFVYGGRKPYPNQRQHWPPILPLKKWVRRKLNLDESVAYGVRAKIGIEGIEPNPFVDRAIKNLQERYK